MTKRRLLNLFACINFILVFLLTLPGLLYIAILSLIGSICYKPMAHYAGRCMIAPDQWWNAALRGEEDETVSSRLGRAYKSGRPKLYALFGVYAVNMLFIILKQQFNHCVESIEHRYDNGAPSDESWNWIKEEKKNG